MSADEPTFIGQVASVSGASVRVRLREDMPSPIVLVNGDSYRVGQIGAYVRIPLGYTQLYAICTQIGADAMPPTALPANELSHSASGATAMSGFRWMTVALFGEGVAKEFERGVSQYPTIGDEVHLVTADDLNTIYGRVAPKTGTVSVGQIAGSSGIPAELNVSGMVSRHTVVVGSTGSGKSNLVAVLLEAVSSGVFPSARTLVIDPHGEYASAVGDRAAVFRVSPKASKGEMQLRVPFWALPFEHLCGLTLGQLQPHHEVAIREAVIDLKGASAKRLRRVLPEAAITADSPIPFSIKKLWHELDEFEGMTFSASGTGQNEATRSAPIEMGDPEILKPTRYPPASPLNQAPYYNGKRRLIDRQLTMMRTRLKDPRFKFLFEPSGGCTPDSEGTIGSDLDAVVSEWVGHDKPITVLDVSGVPSEVRATIVGTMLRVVYDCLFWAGSLPVSGRNQPLFIVLDEAHLFVPDDQKGLAHDTLAMIAKEGRKYGIGLMLVTQRPSELDKTVMSQCGSLIALRLTNGADRAHVAAAVPDDLGGLIEQLPTLRTGEGLFLGEVLPIPSRVRVRKAANKPVGGDPLLDEQWRRSPRPSSNHYEAALANWRAQAVLEPVPSTVESDTKEP
ncbi:MAG: ATP-binding protein [Planctomycetota bacterium]|nr:MAG: ATP-binding protein [Planctomycetota bacterium]